MKVEMHKCCDRCELDTCLKDNKEECVAWDMEVYGCTPSDKCRKDECMEREHCSRYDEWQRKIEMLFTEFNDLKRNSQNL